MANVSITTFNVNSIGARLPNVLAWLDRAMPDIVLLQELKCVDEAFPALEIRERGYTHIETVGQKTYNGVAILSKFPLTEVLRALPGDTADEQARYVEAVADIHGQRVRVASAYVPNGQSPDSDKFVYKMGFYDRLYAHWQQRVAQHELAVLGGDFNCAPTPRDVYDPKLLDGTVCYHPAERAKLRRLLHLGLYDAWRMKHPHAQQYSWWDYRGDGYGRGHGLRIDHLLLSARASDALVDCQIDEHPRAQEKPSDHAPVTASFRF